MIAHILLHHSGNIAERLIVSNISHQQVLHPHALLDHRWNHQQEDNRQHQSCHEESAEDAKNAVFHPTTVLEEFHQGEEQIGDEPSQEKRHKHITQPIEQHHDAHQYHYTDGATYEAIKRDLSSLIRPHRRQYLLLFPLQWYPGDCQA